MPRDTNLPNIVGLYAEWEREEIARELQQGRLKALFARAKGDGHNTKALRSAFRQKFDAKTETAEQAAKREKNDAETELYLLALARVRESRSEGIGLNASKSGPDSPKSTVEEINPVDATDSKQASPENSPIDAGEALAPVVEVTAPSAGTGGDEDRQPIPDQEPVAITPADPLRSEAATGDAAVTPAPEPFKTTIQATAAPPAQVVFEDAIVDPRCKRPGLCRAFSTYGLCDECKDAAGVARQIEATA